MPWEVRVIGVIVGSALITLAAVMAFFLGVFFWALFTTIFTG